MAVTNPSASLLQPCLAGTRDMSSRKPPRLDPCVGNNIDQQARLWCGVFQDARPTWNHDSPSRDASANCQITIYLILERVVLLIHPVHSLIEQTLDLLLETISFILQLIETLVNHIEPLNRIPRGGLVSVATTFCEAASTAALMAAASAAALAALSPFLGAISFEASGKLGYDTTCHGASEPCGPSRGSKDDRLEAKEKDTIWRVNTLRLLKNVMIIQ
ncbi:hypothetical protein GQ457_17G006820 [Hibiscus cannabinus]